MIGLMSGSYTILSYILFLGCALFFASELLPLNHSVLELVFLDVGQGDAILITSPLGKQILIDAGKDGDLGASLSRYMPRFDRSLDVVVMTHPDLDHIGGMFSVFAEYDIGRIIHSAAPLEKKEQQELFAMMDEQDIPHTIARVGTRIVLEDNLFLEILSAAPLVYTDTNEYSLVIKLVYGNTSAILTGDASILNEYDMLQVYGDYLTTDILKAGHHGSRTSSSRSWLRQLAASYTILSFGCDNGYGHPHEEVLSRLTGRVLDTCRQGDIRFISSQEQWFLDL